MKKINDNIVNEHPAGVNHRLLPATERMPKRLADVDNGSIGWDNHHSVV